MKHTSSNEDKKLLKHSSCCDRYDYLTAVACGAIGGIIDIFLVGIPSDSTLGELSSELTDSLVIRFAKLVGWNPKPLQKKNVSSAIGYLEKNFKINYDQRCSSDVKGLFNMSTKNHHIMSLAHSPSPVGLFFSVLNQLTSTSSFLSKGEFVTIPTEPFELRGNNLIQKIFFGIVNWFGHIMSDIAGSSGSRGNSGHGTGIVMPFYELFQYCNFGKFPVKDARQDFATIAVRAFEDGYDLRFGMAQATSVLITDLLICFLWAVRRHFQYGESIKNCISSRKHTSLRIMLLCGNLTLCVMDGLDASLRSGGNFLLFFLRLNLPAWFLLVSRVLKEACIKVGMGEWQLEAYKEINKALEEALAKLKTEKENFQEAAAPYITAAERLSTASSQDELNSILLDLVESMEIELPWKGSFDSHMSDKNARLEFK